MKTEEKLKIHELLSRAAHGYDERQLELLASCFDEDARMTMRVAGQDIIGPFTGRDAIMQLMGGSMAAQSDKRRHVVSNLFFHEEGESAATASSNLTLFSIENGVARLVTTGVYTDRVAKRDGAWRIVDRHLDLDSAF